jgi:hydroxymethylglutaryl-CoA reductase (NADPH)
VTQTLSVQRLWEERLVRGEVSLHKLPQEWSETLKAQTRLNAVTQFMNRPELKKRMRENGVIEAAAGRNCEQMVGEITLPLAVAGPLIIGGKEKWKGYVPLATTEGALVASIQRGMKVVGGAGGALVVGESRGVTRAPVFQVTGLEHGQQVIWWIKKHQSLLKQKAALTSHHLRLTNTEVQLVGRSLLVRFGYSTGEAMGMNMVTIATEALSQLIEAKTQAKRVALSGNWCVDKKPAWSNFINGRGERVQAEVVILRDIVETWLKTTPEQMVEVVIRKDWLGSMMAGSMGFNGHFANIIAAIYLATGQDLGHVVEGALGVTTAEVVSEGLYFSVLLPDLMVGTVGGGTHLPVQKACLELMGLGMGKKGEKQYLAKIVGATVLAGELSLTAALASQDLAKSHQRLGRGKV